MESHRLSVSPSLLFQGRPGDPRLGQWVRPIASLKEISGKKAIVLVGCPDDMGVMLNRGRAGAKEGPDSIRKHLYKMTLPMDFDLEKRLSLFDYGNLIPGSDIAETHRRAFVAAREVGAAGLTLITLGGGHDFAAPSFLGFREGHLSAYKSTKQKWALINIDPHLDVRPLENHLPHSGTPFRQVLEDEAVAPNLFLEFGARANRNSREHYEYCRNLGVRVETLENIRSRPAPVPKQFEKHLRAFGTKASFVGVTFDMDSCSESDGTSAAPVLGFRAEELCQMAAIAGSEPKVQYFEIAEVAPPLESTDRSARIAAEMIFAFLKGVSLRQGPKGSGRKPLKQ